MVYTLATKNIIVSVNKIIDNINASGRTINTNDVKDESIFFILLEPVYLCCQQYDEPACAFLLHCVPFLVIA